MFWEPHINVKCRVGRTAWATCVLRNNENPAPAQRRQRGPLALPDLGLQPFGRLRSCPRRRLASEAAKLRSQRATLSRAQAHQGAGWQSVVRDEVRIGSGARTYKSAPSGTNYMNK